MGPLWAWVILWLISTYGLVLLLRSALARTAVEPVSVLVATPKPVEPPSEEAPQDLAPEGEVLTEEGEELNAAVPGAEEAEPAPMFEADESVVERSLPPAESIEEPPVVPEPIAPEPVAIILPTDLEASDDEAPLGASEPWIKEKDEPTTSEPWVKEKDEPITSEPWIKEKDEPITSEPWIKEKDDAPWISDMAANEVSDPSIREAEEAISIVQSEGENVEKLIHYRSIDLESLTLGLAATEVQSLYGPPGHLSKVGEDGEQWRYHLNAMDEQGNGVEGVLVLEFQRGHLVRKALEENEADD